MVFSFWQFDFINHSTLDSSSYILCIWASDTGTKFPLNITQRRKDVLFVFKTHDFRKFPSTSNCLIIKQNGKAESFMPSFYGNTFKHCSFPLKVSLKGNGKMFADGSAFYVCFMGNSKDMYFVPSCNPLPKFNFLDTWGHLTKLEF